MKNVRNFWTACPKRLEYYPEVSCPLGKNSLTQNDAPKCQWFVNSNRDKFCFWTWIRRKSTSEGEMAPLMQNEIGELLLIPNSKIHAELKTALDNLKNSKEFKTLAEKK